MKNVDDLMVAAYGAAYRNTGPTPVKAEKMNEREDRIKRYEGQVRQGRDICYEEGDQQAREIKEARLVTALLQVADERVLGILKEKPFRLLLIKWREQVRRNKMEGMKEKKMKGGRWRHRARDKGVHKADPRIVKLLKG